MGGLSRASLWGEAGSREREFRESRAGQGRAGRPPKAGRGRGGRAGRAGQGVPPNWRGRVDRGGGTGAFFILIYSRLRCTELCEDLGDDYA